MEQKYECKFCGKKFHKETTLNTHVCVKKQRHQDINSAGSRFGFRTYQRFYELTMNSQKARTHSDFIDSQYYIDFVKFGNHVALLKPVFPEKFIEFVIMNGVKLKDWTKDFVYDTYIEDFIKKEPAMSAVERTINEITEWCETNKVEFSKFFSSISTNEAAYLIKTGKISPWVLYLCAGGADLMNRFNEEHGAMMHNIIDPGFWLRRFKKEADDVDHIKSVLEAANL